MPRVPRFHFQSLHGLQEERQVARTGRQVSGRANPEQDPLDPRLWRDGVPPEFMREVNEGMPESQQAFRYMLRRLQHPNEPARGYYEDPFDPHSAPHESPPGQALGPHGHWHDDRHAGQQRLSDEWEYESSFMPDDVYPAQHSHQQGRSEYSWDDDHGRFQRTDRGPRMDTFEELFAMMHSHVSLPAPPPPPPPPRAQFLHTRCTSRSFESSPPVHVCQSLTIKPPFLSPSHGVMHRGRMSKETEVQQVQAMGTSCASTFQ